MNSLFRVGVGLLALFSLAATSAQPKIEFTQETLDNGLHVIYAPLHQAPVVHVRVVYHVGSRDERADRQGFAHMFEHMMFRGSAHVAPEEHMKRIGVVGGISNAFTGFDNTTNVNTVPAQYLDMALWLEADRMASFKVSDEIFQTERKVVAEEWRMRQNQPYGNIYEKFLDAAFTAHPYRWTPIGNMDHLRAASSSELQEFFNTYYVPNNATLVIAGDFDPAKAQATVWEFFGWIPKSAPPPRGQIKAEPVQKEAREVTIEEAVPLTLVIIGYPGPEYRSDDHFALAALDTILGGGVSSRLNQKLVNKAQLCVNAGSEHLQLEDPAIFGVTATVLSGKDPEKVRQMLVDEVADIVKNGVTPAELEKAKTIQKVAVIHGLETAENLASQLGEEGVLGHDPERVNTSLAKIEALTVADVQKVAAKYLKPEQSTTLIMKPSIAAAFAAKAASTQAAAMKTASVAPSAHVIEPRVKDFPKDYPTTAPSADPRKNPIFAKGEESSGGASGDGVKVIVMPDHRLPVASWSVTLRRGSQSDPKGKEGVAWLTAELLRRGAGGMSMEELHKDLDGRGISISVGDNGDYTRLNGSCTSDQLETAIERSRQVLREPALSAEEFAKLKEQSLSRLKLEQESPTSAAGNEMTTALWGDTPLGRFATPASVAGVTLDDVKAFYAANYHPAGAIFMISGDVTSEQGKKLAGKLLDGWKSSELPTIQINLPTPAAKRRIILVDRPEGKQATVRLGIPAYDIRSSDKFAGSVASQILTAGIDSRLGRYVRAKKGLAYSVHGVFSPSREAGQFTGAVDTAIETTADAVEAMFKVFADMRDADVTPAELAEAKMRVSGRMVMAVQTIDQQAGYRVEGVLNGYPIDYYDKYPARVAQVTPEEVRAVMQKYVDDGRMTIVVVAPAAMVKEQLEKLGEVEVVPMPSKREVAATQPMKKAA